MCQTSEGKFRRIIAQLLNSFGSMNTTQIKQLIPEFYELTSEDKAKSKSRKNESKYVQRIGNIISHQKNGEKYYNEGFFIHKNKNSEALFIPVIGKSNPQKIDKNYNKKRHIFFNFMKNNKGIIKNKNYIEQEKRNNDIGVSGEDFVMQYENDILEKNNLSSQKDRLIHSSKSFGDGLGYDISSINVSDGSTRYIEVKTTSGDWNTPFFMSYREYIFLSHHKNSSYVYRVYNFNIENNQGMINKYSFNDLKSKYNKRTNEFLFTIK